MSPRHTCTVGLTFAYRNCNREILALATFSFFFFRGTCSCHFPLPRMTHRSSGVTTKQSYGPATRKKPIQHLDLGCIDPSKIGTAWAMNTGPNQESWPTQQQQRHGATHPSAATCTHPLFWFGATEGIIINKKSGCRGRTPGHHHRLEKAWRTREVATMRQRGRESS